MEITTIILLLIVGAIAGWLAGLIMRGGGFGLIGNIVIGVIGALVGGFILFVLGVVALGLLGFIIAAVLGAVILLAIVGWVKRT